MRAGALALAVVVAVACGGRRAEPLPQVVFVCEKGSVKSVIAATHFAARARARGVAIEVHARAVTPVAELAPVTLAGLAADGLTPIEAAPVRATAAELQRATRVIAFQPLDGELAASARALEIWNVPPVSDGYDAARTEMVRRADRLLDDLIRDDGR